MKLKDCRDSYYYNSGKASDLGRNLCFVGLGLIWAFKITQENGIVIPTILRWAGMFLLIGLGLDFLQYITGTIIWGIYNRTKEQQVDEQKEFLAPPKINWPTFGLFWIKQIAVLIGCVLLIISMYKEFWQ